MRDFELENDRLGYELEACECKILYRTYFHRKIVGVFDFSYAIAMIGPLLGDAAKKRNLLKI